MPNICDKNISQKRKSIFCGWHTTKTGVLCFSAVSHNQLVIWQAHRSRILERAFCKWEIHLSLVGSVILREKLFTFCSCKCSSSWSEKEGFSTVRPVPQSGEAGECMWGKESESHDSLSWSRGFLPCHVLNRPCTYSNLRSGTVHFLQWVRQV